MHQVAQRLIAEGTPPKHICYFSVDHPIFNGLGLDNLLELYAEAASIDLNSAQLFILYDEIQYLKGWEIHLKTLVDRYSNIKFLVSGSSAAALKLKKPNHRWTPMDTDNNDLRKELALTQGVQDFLQQNRSSSVSIRVHLWFPSFFR